MSYAFHKNVYLKQAIIHRLQNSQKVGNPPHAIYLMDSIAEFLDEIINERFPNSSDIRMAIMSELPVNIRITVRPVLFEYLRIARSDPDNRDIDDLRTKEGLEWWSRDPTADIVPRCRLLAKIIGLDEWLFIAIIYLFQLLRDLGNGDRALQWLTQIIGAIPTGATSYNFKYEFYAILLQGDDWRLCPIPETDKAEAQLLDAVRGALLMDPSTGMVGLSNRNQTHLKALAHTVSEQPGLHSASFYCVYNILNDDMVSAISCAISARVGFLSAWQIFLTRLKGQSSSLKPAFHTPLGITHGSARKSDWYEEAHKICGWLFEKTSQARPDKSA